MSKYQNAKRLLAEAKYTIAAAQDELNELSERESFDAIAAITAVAAIPPPKSYKDEFFAIAVGHSRQGDTGAISVDGTPEWDYNNAVALDLFIELQKRGIPCFIINDYVHSAYTPAINNMARKLRERRATAGMELHFNAADGDADEEEYLYWHSSVESKRLAETAVAEHIKLDPDKRTRGAKPRKNGNGSYALKTTPCPFMIAEPFFGDNAREWEQWGSDEGKKRLVQIYANTIQRFYDEKAS
jgi:N-acetylmuramoyl-L-alanine amidase